MPSHFPSIEPVVNQLEIPAGMLGPDPVALANPITAIERLLDTP